MQITINCCIEIGGTKMIKLSMAGMVKQIDNNTVTIDTDGELNQVIFSSLQDIKSIKAGQNIKFYAEIINEVLEELVIYGYLSKNVRLFVSQFESVPGVGRKCAMEIYNTLTERGMSMNDICFEISAGNAALLSTINGIGPKAAQRIIDSLQNSIIAFSDSKTKQNSNLLVEAKEILLSLGFVQSDIENAISEVKINLEGSAMEIVENVVSVLQ